MKDDLIPVLDNIPSNVYLNAVFGSMLSSALLFLFRRREASLFVGLWVPGILGLAIYTQLMLLARGRK